MTASYWLVAGLACAQLGPPVEPAPANPPQDAREQPESVPPPRRAVSQISAVTVYQGQALVLRQQPVTAYQLFRMFEQSPTTSINASIAGVAGRSSSSSRLCAFSTSNARSPSSVRPTMRPLPFKV